MAKIISLRDVNSISEQKGGAITGKKPMFTDPTRKENFIGQIVAVLTLDETTHPSIEHSIFTYPDQLFVAAAVANVYECEPFDIEFVQVGNKVGVVYIVKNNNQVDFTAYKLAEGLKTNHAQFHDEDQIYRYGNLWKVTFMDQQTFNFDIEIMSKTFKLMKRNGQI